ncbi:MAG TPA: LytTR family DNA-binding domain-containing protein [Saprospiraceae bacterium]|nr:LytTR family DNA-binding domain-containing protein [Saprospiraceae bacterium]HMQ85045.1 LytTR family DNA-binding domain-containing protein [Saprospiraceae bacterium]
MKVLIVEDERPAALRLQKMILEARPSVEIVAVKDSVEGAVAFLQALPPLDLMFLDIQLADGLSFDIFTQVEIAVPVIFTTAFDQYTLKAFKLNSIDYLLKPIDNQELIEAFDKFDRFFDQRQPVNLNSIQAILESFSKPSYKERFIVKIGQQLAFISTEEIRYFYFEDGLVFAQTKDKKHAIDFTLDQLEGQLDPHRFFRVNRKMITAVAAINRVSPYFNSRYVIDMLPKPGFEVIVSRDRASDFKQWLDQ